MKMKQRIISSVVCQCLSLSCVLTLVLFGCHSGGGSDQQEAFETDRRVLGEFHTMEKNLAAIDAAGVPELALASLADLISRSRSAYASGDFCQATEEIDDFLQRVQTGRTGHSVAVAEDLFNRAWSLRSNMLLETAGGNACEGYEGLGRKPQVAVIASDNSRLQGRVIFGSPRFVTAEAGDDPQTYSQLFIPGLPEWSVQAGLPDIPMFRRMIAIPRGSTATVVASATLGALLKLNLYPAQPMPPDQDDEGVLYEPVFTKDEDAYSQDALFPAELCSINPLGLYRDLELAQVECAAAQYNPATESLQLFDSVDFEVLFTGEDGNFISSLAQNPFEPTERILPTLLNGDVAGLYVEEKEIPLATVGEEFLIITPAAFRPAAEALSEWKSDKGIITKVFDLDQIQDLMAAEISPEVIDAFIEQRYDYGIIRPTYVLLLGGYEEIPEYAMLWHHYSNTLEYWWPTDYGYADYQGSLLPFFAVGRVRVETLEQAQHYVDKVIGYEMDPPEDPAFYRNILEAGYFQTEGHADCPDADGTDAEVCGRTGRWFIESSEFSRAFLQEAGYAVERAYTGRFVNLYTPTWYKDSSFLPEEIGYGSLFGWDGEAAGMVAAINAGRFLVTHRDHGDFDGWVDPSFRDFDVADLENGDRQPVVFSINCLSGYGTFVDRLLVQNAEDPSASAGGAVGVLAATRVSYSGYNDALYRGLIDSVWPAALPDYGDPADSPRVLGDMLLYAKLYTSSIYDPDLSEAETEESYMQLTIREHQVWGDPTLQLWTEQPGVNLDFYQVAENDSESLIITYPTDGAVITAYQRTAEGVHPLGRGKIINGGVTLNYIQASLAQVPILLSVTKANAVGLLLTPELSVGSESLAFGTSSTELDLALANTGGGTLEWSLSALPGWLSVSPAQGELAANETASLAVQVDRSGLVAGDYSCDLTFATNVLNAERATQTLAVTMTVAGAGSSLLTLVKTGLTESYDENGNVATGLLDDGFYQYGENFGFTDNGDGSVTDQVTGLRWLQSSSENEYSYADAEDYCSAMTQDGGGWRIPNVYEYYSILNFAQSNPALDHAVFSSLSGYYWTATPMADSTLHVWTIREPYADDAIYSSVSGDNYVRCVKGDALAPPAIRRFADNGSGTVLDNWTGLVWEAVSSNGTSGYSWQEAISYCESKTTLERSWHLPNVKQMQALLPKDMESPARDGEFFSGDSATLWTSTTDVYTNGGDKDLAWAANEAGAGDFVMAGVFKTSRIDDNSQPMGARCVSW